MENLGTVIHDVEQGSIEWNELRLGRLTASNFNQVMTPTGKAKTGKAVTDYMYQLLAESLQGFKQEVFASSLEFGSMYEPEAIKEYEIQTFQKVQPVGFLAYNDLIGGSPDGMIDRNVIEVKCTFNTKNHIKYIEEQAFIQEYQHQIQGNIWLANADYCDFISFAPNFPEPHRLYIHKVERDEKYIAVLQESVSEFIADYNLLRKKYGLI